MFSFPGLVCLIMQDHKLIQLRMINQQPVSCTDLKGVKKKKKKQSVFIAVLLLVLQKSHAPPKSVTCLTEETFNKL